MLFAKIKFSRKFPDLQYSVWQWFNKKWCSRWVISDANVSSVYWLIYSRLTYGMRLHCWSLQNIESIVRFELPMKHSFFKSESLAAALKYCTFGKFRENKTLAKNARFRENKTLAKWRNQLFTDIGKSYPSCEFLTSQICLLTLFAKIKLSRKFPNLQ